MIKAQDIKDFGKSIGIDEIRITTVEPFAQDIVNYQEQRARRLFTDRHHRHFKNIGQFYDIRKEFPEARSIIAACQCYLTDEECDLAKPDDPHGLIARYTWRNYYLRLKDKLQQLGDYIHAKTDASCRAYSNGPVAEKPIAVRSGIGHYGKHSIVINQTFGSWIVLGEILTDLELEADSPVDTDCGQCQECITACPTHAIIEPYILDRRRCIQELTNWYGVLPDDIAEVWANRLYGCTVCQDVCPTNSNVAVQDRLAGPGYVGPSLSLNAILDMSEEEYRKRYPNNQITARWINFQAIQRNALICLGNIKDKKAMPTLEVFCKSKDQVIATTAKWAKERIING